MSSSCEKGGTYYSNKTVSAAFMFPTYFYNLSVCCMNAIVIQNYIINIGKDIGNYEIFLSYGFILNTTFNYVGANAI